MIQPFVKVSQNVSEDFMQGQLSQGSLAFQTTTGQLVAEEEDHSFLKEHLEMADLKLKVVEENNIIDLENMPQDGIVQRLKMLEIKPSEDIVYPHSLKVKRAIPLHGPEEEDTEQMEMFSFPVLTSICTDDLPDLEDAEPTLAFSNGQSSKVQILLYPKDEETY